uniref:Uncharacterized protein n=1 Tax=Arundo donax TaxID=35708 RepID=A0A0A9FQD1_ARUDO
MCLWPSISRCWPAGNPFLFNHGLWRLCQFAQSRGKHIAPCLFCALVRTECI